MASNRGLYSSNARPLGQRPVEDDLSESPGAGEGSSSHDLENQQQPQAEGSAQYVRTGGYTMISPNSSKRQQLTSQAQQEMKAYEDYKASKKAITISGEAQSTGGKVSEEEARRALEREYRNTKYDQILKREKWQREKREREEKKYQEKKARARETAERNKQRQAEREKNFLKGDHARINDRFLKRLEAN